MRMVGQHKSVIAVVVILLSSSGGCRELAAASISRASVPVCSQAHGLTTRMSVGSGAGGTNYFHIIYTNTASAVCSLSGIPGVQPVDGARHTSVGPSSSLDKVSGRGGTVLLAARGGKANTVYAMEDVGDFSRSKCAPKHTDGVRIHLKGVPVIFTA